MREEEDKTVVANDPHHRMRRDDDPLQKPELPHSGACDCSAFLSRAKAAGYTDEDAQTFYNDVVSEQATNNVVNFLMRRPDYFKEGVVKEMNDVLKPWSQHAKFIHTNDSNRPAIPQDLSANVEQVSQT